MSPKPTRSRPGQPSKPLAPQVEELHVGEQPAPPPAKPQTPAARKSGTAEDVPRWRRLMRFEGRLRLDQVNALSELRRRVSRARTDRSERITDNTLVRVAVDVLLKHADALHGDTEEQLREALLTALATKPGEEEKPAAKPRASRATRT